MPDTKLQDLREQYPQYADWSDDELAQAMYETHYSDMEREDFNEQLGLAAPAPPPPEPSLWDRVKSKFSDDQEKPANVLDDRPDPVEDFALPEETPKDDPYVPGDPYGSYYRQKAIDDEAAASAPKDTGPTYRDQLFAGTDEYLANRDTQSIFALGEQYVTARERASGIQPGGMTPDYFSGADEMEKYARSLRAEAWRTQPDKYPEYRDDYYALQEDIEASREQLIGRMQEAIDRRQVRKERAAQIPYSETTQEMLEAEGFFEGLDEWADDPINIMMEVGIRSAPNMTDSIPLAIAGSFAGPWGFAAGLGMGSGMAEYRASYSEYMEKAGIDMTDARSVMAAIDNPELMDAANAYALKRGAIIGAVDVVTGKLATTTMAPLVKSALGKELMNVALQTGVQVTGGMVGETGAIVATEGLEALATRGGEIVAEGVGEGVTVIVDVGGATLTGMRAQDAQAKAARIEAEAEAMLSDWVVDDPAVDDTEEVEQEDQVETPVEDDVEETDTLIRHADENWTVRVTQRYPDGNQDVTVIDRFGNETLTTLLPGESYTQAVEMVEAGRTQADIDDAQRRAGEAEIDDDPGTFYDNPFEDQNEETQAQKDAARNRENATRSGYPTDDELDALTLARARAGIAQDVDAMVSLAEQIRVKQNSLLDEGDIRQQPEYEPLKPDEPRDQAEQQTEEFLAEKKKSDAVTTMQQAMKQLREQFPEADFLGPENEQIAEMIQAAEMDGMFNMLTEWFDLTEDEQAAMTTILAGMDQEVIPADEGEPMTDEDMEEIYDEDLSAMEDQARNLRARIEALETAEQPEAAARLESELIDLLTDIDSRREDVRAPIEGEVVPPTPEIELDPDRVAAWTEEVESWQNRVEKLETEVEFHRNDGNEAGATAASNELQGAKQELRDAQRTLDRYRGPAIEGEATEIAGELAAPMPESTSDLHKYLSEQYDAGTVNELMLGLKVVKKDGTQGTLIGYGAKPAIDFEGRIATDSFARLSKQWTLAPGQAVILQQRVDELGLPEPGGAGEAPPVSPIPPTPGRPKVIDPRLKRQNYREALQTMAAELVHGGGVTYVFDEMDRITSRTPSINPPWFQAMVEHPDIKMSTAQVRAAVNKAIVGKGKLGVRQARAIQYMLDAVSDERGAQVDFAREQLQAARNARQDERAAAGDEIDPNADSRGELFNEDEYSAEQTAESRIIFEMMEEAVALGVDEGLLETLAIRHTDNQEFMNELQGAIDEQRHFRSAQADEAQQGEQPAPDSTATAAPRKPGKRKKLTAIQADAYERVVALGKMFLASEFLELPAITKPGAVSTSDRPNQPSDRRTQNVNTLSALIDKGYVASLDPSRSIFEGRFVALNDDGTPVDPMLSVQEQTDFYMTVPWTMSSKGEGDLYIQRIGDNAGTPYKTRQGPNDIAITFNQNELLPSYMFHLLRFLQKDIQSRARGTAQQAIRMSDIDEALVEHFMRQVKENEQLELYLGEPASENQAGAPQLEEAKDAAVTAIENMRATPSDLGRTVARELAEKRRTNLVGQTANTVEDLAVLAQIYRDPRLETLRVFFTDVQNKIVAQVGLTSRLPDGAPAILGDVAPAYFDRLSDIAKNLGATSFYMQHNHPSGVSNPSNADELVTRSMAQDFRLSPGKIRFRGHVVIDHNNWSEINARGESKTHQKDLGAVQFQPKGGVAGQVIKSPSDAALIAAQADITTTDIVLIHVNNRHIVLNVSTMPGEVIGQDKAKMRRLIQRYALSEAGTARIIAVGLDGSLLKQLDGLVLDALQVTGDGTVRSLATANEITSFGDIFPADRPVRISPDTSEEFDYLRPWAQQIKKTGLNLTVTRVQEMGGPLPSTRLRLKIGDTPIEVLQNPTDAEFRLFRQSVRMEYEAQGFSTTTDPITRSTWDRDGNRFVWQSDQGTHAAIERAVAAHLGVPETALDQNNEGQAPIRAGGDLFGQDMTTEQTMADEIRRRDAKRNSGQEGMETGDPNDLFSDASKQLDIEDQLARDTENKVEERRGRYKGNKKEQTRAQRVKSMPMEDLVNSVFTDELTGVGNLRAYNEEAKMLPVQAIVDADSLKWVNDNLGLDAGDAMLVAIAEALNQEEVEVYRIGGDEFVVAGWNETEVRAALELAQGILANEAVESSQGRHASIGITFGIGRNKPAADIILKAKKSHKERTGQRAGRGETPAGSTVSVVGPQPLDMESGQNYVGMIGKRGALPINPQHNLVLGNGRIVRIPKKPVRREHILAVMRKYFGNRIYEGRVKGQMRLGFYRPGHGEVRLKDANDIEVAAHEIAHFLDDRNPWVRQLYMQFSDEMKGVSYDVTKVFEGYAEFMRLYFTQESAAMERAPGFYDAWRDAMASRPDLQGMVEDVQELMHAWTMQGARARGAGKQGTADASFWEKIARRFPVPFWQLFLDGLRSIKKIELDLGALGPEELVAYEKARIALGGSPGLIDAAFRFGTPMWREDGQGIEFSGEALQEIFGEHWGDHDVGMYLLARRAQELQSQGRENLMRPDEIIAWLSLEDEIEGLRDIHDRYQEFNDRMLDFYEGAGIIGAQTRAKMQEMNKNYVPFFRVVESRINGRPARSGGNPFQRLKGGTTNVGVIWDNIIEGVAIGVNAALMNDAKRSILRKLGGTDRLGAGVRNQQAGLYAAPISADNAARKISGDQVLKASVEAMGWTMAEYRMAKAMPSDETEQAIVMIIEQMEDGLPNFLTLFEFNQDPKGNVDFYMDQGRKYHFEIMDPALMDSLRFMGPKGTNLVLQIVGGFSATLRRGVVAWPTFQTKNFVRDSLNAWLLSTKVKVPAVRAAAQILRRMSNDPAFQEMVVNGGGFANRSQGFEVARHLISNPTELLTRYDRFMGRFENANRLAEYKLNRKAGKGPRHSALLSREISTDFAMRGSHEVARFLAVSVPFLNARMQGNYRLKRQMDYGTMAASFAIRGAAYMAASLALYSLNKDDDRYEEMPEDIKDLYHPVFTGNGEDDYFLIPKPFESGMLFGTIPERFMQYTEDQDGEEFVDAMLWIALQAFSLDMTPQVFQPLMDIERNKTFTGAPIIPFYLENVEPSEQFTWYTSETAKAAARAMGVSPMKLEHMIRGYFGTMGTYALAASDAMIRAATDDYMNEYGEFPSRGETWRENIVVKGLIDWSVNEGPPRRTKYVSDLYDMVREAEKVANTMALMQKRQSELAEEYITNPQNQFYALLVRSSGGNQAPLAHTRSALNEVRQAMDAIRMDTTMTSDEKRLELWNLTRRRNELARSVMEEIKRAENELEMEMGDPQNLAQGVEDVVNLAQGVPPEGFTGNVQLTPEEQQIAQ
jgi:diguanylate cyclase (GGDEF)-like protein